MTQPQLPAQVIPPAADPPSVLRRIPRHVDPPRDGSTTGSTASGLRGRARWMLLTGHRSVSMTCVPRRWRSGLPLGESVETARRVGHRSVSVALDRDGHLLPNTEGTSPTPSKCWLSRPPGVRKASTSSGCAMPGRTESHSTTAHLRGSRAAQATPAGGCVCLGPREPPSGWYRARTSGLCPVKERDIVARSPSFRAFSGPLPCPN